MNRWQKNACATCRRSIDPVRILVYAQTGRGIIPNHLGLVLTVRCRSRRPYTCARFGAYRPCLARRCSWASLLVHPQVGSHTTVPLELPLLGRHPCPAHFPARRSCKGRDPSHASIPLPFTQFQSCQVFFLMGRDRAPPSYGGTVWLGCRCLLCFAATVFSPPLFVFE